MSKSSSWYILIIGSSGAPHLQFVARATTFSVIPAKYLKIDLYFYRGTESQVQKNRRKARRLLEELEFIKVQHFSHKIFVILV